VIALPWLSDAPGVAAQLCGRSKIMKAPILGLVLVVVIAVILWHSSRGPYPAAVPREWMHPVWLPA
jgi:hypothetical protein